MDNHMKQNKLFFSLDYLIETLDNPQVDGTLMF